MNGHAVLNVMYSLRTEKMRRVAWDKPIVEAKSIYLGGEEISATDRRLTSSSYKKLGLRCTICGEPVYFRKGNVNQPHFAHFPNIDPTKREDCERRRSIFSSGSFSIQEMDKGQRLKLFQEYFIRIIQRALSDLELETAIPIQSIASESIQLQALSRLRNNRKGFFRYLEILNQKNSDLEVEITCEALDYLTIISSERLFWVISTHLLSNQADFELSDENVDFHKELCLKVCDVIIGIDWLEKLTEIVEFNSNYRLKSNTGRRSKPAKRYFRRVEERKNLIVYLHKDKLFLGEESFGCLEEKGFLGTVNISHYVKQLRQRPAGNNTRKVENAIASIVVAPRHGGYYDYQDSIMGSFLPTLKQSIRNTDRHDSRASIRILGGKKSKVVYLEATTKEFLAKKRAHIRVGKSLGKGGVVAEVRVESSIGLEGNNSSGHLFVPSVTCKALTKESVFLQDAVVQTIQEIANTLSQLSVRLSVGACLNYQVFTCCWQRWGDSTIFPVLRTFSMTRLQLTWR